MAHYLMKYKDKYRVVANFNKNTNDYPRLENGTIDPSFTDLYIKCKDGNYIYHYGHSTLVAVYLSVKKGHNAIKSLYENNIGTFPETIIWQDIYKELEEKDIIFDVEETDAELFFKFKDKNFDNIAQVIKPSTFGAGINPFSTRNLPNIKYSIPEEDMKAYKEITSVIDKNSIAIIAQATRKFVSHISTKKWTAQDIKADMKKQGLSGRNYFHANGYWSQYLDFLKKYIQERIEE